MCNLDIIGGDPLTQEQLWNRWLFNSLQDEHFVVMLVIFGAVFVMAVSVLVLFGVMLLKHLRKDVAKPAVEADGSVDLVPFICSTVGSIMFVFGLFVVVMFAIFWEYTAFYMLQYSFAVWYAVVMAALFGIALFFSPRAGKLYKTWNKVCLILSLLVVAAGVYFSLFTWSLYNL